MASDSIQTGRNTTPFVVSPKPSGSRSAGLVLHAESLSNNAVSGNECSCSTTDSDSESKTVSDGSGIGYSGSAYRRCRCGARLEPAQKYCSHECYSSSLRVPLVDRFWSKVNRNGPVQAHCPELGPCWPFTGKARFRGGYGQIADRKNGKFWPRLTHRVAWELTFGPIQEDLGVLHKCDNPLCCNPSHLFLGTRADNLTDARNKGRLVDGLHARVLSDEAYLDILTSSRESGSGVALAKKYGVSKTTISRIRNGRQGVTFHRQPIDGASVTHDS